MYQCPISRIAGITTALAFSCFLLSVPSIANSANLPSWTDGPAKKAVVAFVEKITREGGSDYVAPSERIAVFDNDGTLWSEQPMYVQLAFVFDRVKALSNNHPEWKDKQPFKAVLEHDTAALAKSGKKGLMELIMVTHAGMSAEEFDKIASDWIKTAKHPKTGKPYTEMIYQPMLERLVSPTLGGEWNVHVRLGKGEVSLARSRARPASPI